MSGIGSESGATDTPPPALSYIFTPGNMVIDDAHTQDVCVTRCRS